MTRWQKSSRSSKASKTRRAKSPRRPTPWVPGIAGTPRVPAPVRVLSQVVVDVRKIKIKEMCPRRRLLAALLQVGGARRGNLRLMLRSWTVQLRCGMRRPRTPAGSPAATDAREPISRRAENEDRCLLPWLSAFCVPHFLSSSTAVVSVSACPVKTFPCIHGDCSDRLFRSLVRFKLPRGRRALDVAVSWQ